MTADCERVDDEPHEELALRVMKALAFDLTDHLWWRLPDGGGDLLLFINAGDFFYWACSDLEPIETMDDALLLEQCIAECQVALNEKWPNEGPLLYAARHRKMRPQRPYYKHLDERVHALFDAAGPERTRESEG